MKLNKFFSTIAAGALVLGLGACTDEVSYDPTAPYQGNEVYFAENEQTSLQMLPEETSVDVTLYRVKADADLEVALTYEAVDPDGNEVNDLFSVPSTITFPKDAKEIAVPISYAFDKITSDTKYTVTITIDGKETSPWGLSQMTFSLSYAPWSEWERVSSEPVSASYGWPFGIQFLQYLYTRNSLVNENKVQYMVPDPYSDVDFELIFEIDKTDFYINEDGDKCYRVRTPQVGIDLEIDKEGNKLAMQDIYSWYMWAWDNTKTPEDAYKWMAGRGYGESNFNTRTGLLSVDYMCFSFTIEQGSAYQNAYYYFQFPGYADYSFAFNQVGSFVTTDGDESAVVSVYKGNDVHSFAATCLEGELNETQVEAAAKALVESGKYETYTDNPTELRLPMKDNGVYTLVVVGFDEMMNQVAVDSFVFEFESVQKENEWADFGQGDFTDYFLGGNIGFGEEPFEIYTWEVDVQQHKEIPGYFRLTNPYYTWPVNVQYEYEIIPNSKALYIDIHAEDPDGVYVDLSPIGIAIGNDDLYAYSVAANYLAGGQSLEDVKAAGYCGWLENGVIYFPAGTLADAMLPSGQMWPANAEDGELLAIYNLMDQANAPAHKAAPFTGAIRKTQDRTFYNWNNAKPMTVKCEIVRNGVTRFNRSLLPKTPMMFK